MPSTPCTPKHRIVFMKTHKTASATVCTMIYRYGYKNDLNFALPKQSQLFSDFEKFKASGVYLTDLGDENGSSVWPTLGGFQVMATHARYNRAGLNALIPNAVYITIIREPASQFESAFAFYHLSKYIPGKSLTEIFRGDPGIYLNTSKRHCYLDFARNGQMLDFGLEKKNYGNWDLVNDKIQSLSEEMDLVMITEYFDESLILLKRLLCWDFDDITYIAKHVRKVRGNISTDLAGKIRKWSQADVMLYQHFNKTFWKKVQSYGPDFWRDLETFRELQAATRAECFRNMAKTQTIQFKPRAHAMQNCRELQRSITAWTPILRNRLDEKTRNLSRNG